MVQLRNSYTTITCGTFFSISGKKNNGEFKYVHLCNEGRSITAFYLVNLNKMNAEEITPRHGIRNENGNLC